MKASIHLLTLRSTALAGIAFLTLAGCSKKESVQTTAVPESQSAPTQQIAPATQQPVPFSGPPQPQQWMSDAQAQQQAGDYDRAAQYLLQVQRNQQLLNQQQAAAYWKQMSTFQADLATRVAAGDPSAKAAADRLRASAPH